MASVRTTLAILVGTLLLLAPQAAVAGASNFELVNGTGTPITGVAIRRARTDNWRPLAASPAAASRAAIQFSDDDCAFDIRATLPGVGQVIWTGVNLCGAKAVILNRNGAGVLWVDYE